MSFDETEGRVLVVGYGNSLRGDDAAGWIAAERLDELLNPQQALVLIRHQLTPELAQRVSRAGLVILIDADAARPPGEIDVRAVLACDDIAISLMHEVDPAQLLGAALALFGRAPRTLLYSIGADTFELGERLTPPVASAVTEVVRRVVAEVERFVASAHTPAGIGDRACTSSPSSSR